VIMKNYESGEFYTMARPARQQEERTYVEKAVS